MATKERRQLVSLKRFCSLMIFSAVVTHSNSLETRSFAILMPNVSPSQPDTYLCTSVELNPDHEYFVVGYAPNASMNIAHHMLLYGCDEPGTDDLVWDCGEMAKKRERGMTKGPVCRSGSRITYAWARDAPPLSLPDGVAFQIGRGSGIRNLVLQVHYADVSSFVNGHKDDSGISITYTKEPQPRAAGILLTTTGGVIPPKSTVHMEAACTIDEDLTVHPFAFRTHTHTLGKVVSGYRVRRDPSTGIDEWKLIGKRDPMKPQMFYPSNADITIKKGDKVASRCTMVSDRDRETQIGATHEDEMCNFYIMYWVEGSKILERGGCATSGPPDYYWKDGYIPLNNIPDEDASSL